MSLSLLKQLSVHELQSGERLAEQLGVTRAAISKQIQAWRTRGVAIAVHPRGYQLMTPLAWWDEASLQKALAAPHRRCVLCDEVDSTQLMAHHLDDQQPETVLVANYQRAGIGRRQRSWQALPGTQLTWTQRFVVDAPMAAWQGLALAIGAALAAWFQTQSIPMLIKWPNDLLLDDGKVGGILVDISGAVDGPMTLMIGIGINEQLPDVRQLPVDALLPSALPPHPISREATLSALVDCVSEVVRHYPERGFTAYRATWMRYQAWVGQRVRLTQGEHQYDGRLIGMDETGALLIEQDQQNMLTIHAGDLSLRKYS